LTGADKKALKQARMFHGRMIDKLEKQADI
jgi:hypothetical protein